MFSAPLVYSILAGTNYFHMFRVCHGHYLATKGRETTDVPFEDTALQLRRQPAPQMPFSSSLVPCQGSVLLAGRIVADRSAIMAFGSRSEPRLSRRPTPILGLDKALVLQTERRLHVESKGQRSGVGGDGFVFSPARQQTGLPGDRDPNPRQAAFRRQAPSHAIPRLHLRRGPRQARRPKAGRPVERGGNRLQRAADHGESKRTNRRGREPGRHQGPGRVGEASGTGTSQRLRRFSGTRRPRGVSPRSDQEAGRVAGADG